MPEVEEHIRRAMQEGKFEDLAGKGKPLRLDENPLEDPEWRMANRMLRSSGFNLPWIEMRQEIEAQIATARTCLERAWEWRQVALSKNQPGNQMEAEWQRALDAFRKEIGRINKRIADYNLQVPSGQFQLLKLDAEREVAMLVEGQA